MIRRQLNYFITTVKVSYWLTAHVTCVINKSRERGTEMYIRKHPGYLRQWRHNQLSVMEWTPLYLADTCGISLYVRVCPYSSLSSSYCSSSVVEYVFIIAFPIIVILHPYPKKYTINYVTDKGNTYLCLYNHLQIEMIRCGHTLSAVWRGLAWVFWFLWHIFHRFGHTHKVGNAVYHLYYH